MAWYNEYRPTKFEEVIGQDLVKSVLQKALEKGKIKHAYLFSGPKGVGKTTLARIFANSLNDVENKPETTMDIIEMDAASNTGIDDIRQLIESAQNPPISGNYKIYIIDEVHMLSKSAMNALLKILEEPPKYLVFLLATTNPEKLLPTVLSRLTKLNLTNHTPEDIQTNLKQISEKESLKIDDKALKLIAKRSGGGQRDAINLLETVSSYGLDEYSVDQVSEFLGLLPEEEMKRLAEVLLTEDNNQELKEVIGRVEAKGFDGETFLAEFLEFLIDRSFEGRTDFESLILPTAEVLDLKLPVTSLTGAVAILTAKVNEKPITVKKKPEVETGGSRSEAEYDSEKNNSDSLQEEPQNSEFSFPHSGEMAEGQRGWGDSEGVGKQKEITETEVLQILKSLPENPKCPPAYRMFVGDLGVEIISPSKIKATVSSGIFQVTLRSGVVINLIKEELKKQFGRDFEVETGLRNGKQSQSENLDSSVFDESSEDFGFIGEQEITPQGSTNFDSLEGVKSSEVLKDKQESRLSPKDKQESPLTPEPNTESPLTPEPNTESPLTPLMKGGTAEEVKESSDYKHIEKGEIFYKIYKKLPENVDPQKILVINEINLPEEPEKWDDNTADMFDFE